MFTKNVLIIILGKELIRYLVLDKKFSSSNLLCREISLCDKEIHKCTIRNPGKLESMGFITKEIYSV